MRLLGAVAVGLALLAGCTSVPPAPEPTTGAGTSATSTTSTSSASSTAPAPATPLAALTAGVCTGTLPEGSETAEDITVIDCSKEHFWEVSAVVPLMSAGYPGVNELRELATSACSRSFRSYVGVEVAASPYTATFVAPSEGYWAIPEARGLVCLVGSEVGGLTRTLKDHPVVFPETGQCLGEPADGSASYPLTACAKEHLYEVYASSTFSGPKRPTDAEIDKEYTSVCVDGFQEFVGVKLAKSKYEIQYFVLPEEAWEQYSDHRLVCSVGSPSGGITGSLKDAKK